MRGYGRGDQIVQVIVKTPKNLTKKQEEILKQFEGLSRKTGKAEGNWKSFLKVEN